MLILNNEAIDSFSFPDSAVALGSFEALHAGHIELIEKTIECAKKNRIKSVVTIFKAPVLKSRNLVCETLDERLNILESLGIDIAVIFEFDKKFSMTKYDEFFYKYIVEIFNAKFIFTGFNYKFGHKAEGDTNILYLLCKENKIILNIIPPVIINEVVSSTYIHKLIENGDVEILKDVLLRPYSVSGTVKNGRKIGSGLGFPTANIDFPDNKAIIKSGVYFGTIKSKFGEHYAIINVGLQPTVTAELTPKIEAYIFDFSENLYGKTVKLEFLKRMRDIKKFSNINELKTQLEADKMQAYDLISEIYNKKDLSYEVYR